MGKGILVAAIFSSLLLVLAGQTAHPDEITIFFTGFVKGNYGPCGCSAGPTGGVSRRVGYANQFEKEHPGFTIQVDTGNYLQPPGPRSDMINGLMVDSFEEVPLDVLNLGVEDLFWWGDLSKTNKGKTKIISTNLISETPGVPQPDKYAVVVVPADATSSGREIKVGFLGISDPKRIKPNSKFRGVDPLTAVAEVKQRVLEEADILVVLADVRRKGHEIPEESIFRKLAEAHPEIAAILVSERRYRLYRPVRINSTVVLSSVERGRHLGRLTLELDDTLGVKRFESDFIELKEGMPEVEALQAKQDWMTAQLP